MASLGLRNAEDAAIFEEARMAGAMIMSKDKDFFDLVMRHGPPPQVIFVTCGNTSNEFLRHLLQRAFPHILTMLKSGEPLVELSDVL